LKAAVTTTKLPITNLPPLYPYPIKHIFPVAIYSSSSILTFSTNPVVAHA
jgi:hypothetical protein